MKTTASIILLAAFVSGVSVRANDDLPTVHAKAGEGIWSLLRRHGVRPTPEAVSAFADLNRHLLTARNGLRRDVTYRLPYAVDTPTQTYPIFGPKYGQVTVKSQKLQGAVYYVVSGHGGPDPGASGIHAGQRIYEDEYAYDTSLRIARNLIELGATVYLVVQDKNDGIRDERYLPHDEDEVHYGDRTIPLNPVLRLKARVDVINTLFEQHRRTARVQRVIEVHVDSNRDSSMNIDVHFAYHSRAGRALATVLSDTIGKQYEKVQPGRGYRGKIRQRKNLFMLRETKPVGVLIELGNIRYRGDHERFVNPSNRKLLAEWIVLGLLEEAR